MGITALVQGKDVYILNVIRERFDYPALKKRVIEEKQRRNADTILIEDKGSGISLIQDLKQSHIRPIPVLPEGDKVVRMAACSAQIESGYVFLPKYAAWLGDFQTELLAFPYGSNDDQVDALSQLLNWVREGSVLTVFDVL